MLYENMSPKEQAIFNDAELYITTGNTKALNDILKENTWLRLSRGPQELKKVSRKSKDIFGEPQVVSELTLIDLHKEHYSIGQQFGHGPAAKQSFDTLAVLLDNSCQVSNNVIESLDFSNTSKTNHLLLNHIINGVSNGVDKVEKSFVKALDSYIKTHQKNTISPDHMIKSFTLIETIMNKPDIKEFHLEMTKLSKVASLEGRKLEAQQLMAQGGLINKISGFVKKLIIKAQGLASGYGMISTQEDKKLSNKLADNLRKELSESRVRESFFEERPQESVAAPSIKRSHTQEPLRDNHSFKNTSNKAIKVLDNQNMFNGDIIFFIDQRDAKSLSNLLYETPPQLLNQIDRNDSSLMAYFMIGNIPESARFSSAPALKNQVKEEQSKALETFKVLHKELGIKIDGSSLQKLDLKETGPITKAIVKSAIKQDINDHTNKFSEYLKEKVTEFTKNNPKATVKDLSKNFAAVKEIMDEKNPGVFEKKMKEVLKSKGAQGKNLLISGLVEEYKESSKDAKSQTSIGSPSNTPKVNKSGGVKGSSPTQPKR